MSVRTVFEPQNMDAGRYYQLLTASILPRPIAWVSSISADGVANLAPYSFFTVSSTAPPVVQFTSVTRKDSLRNIEATGEFVINLAHEPLMDVVNGSSANYDSDVSEFEALGIDSEASEKVAPRRVAAAPIAIEATLRQVIEVGNCFVVMGDVVAMAVKPEFLADDGLPTFADIAPLSRLGRDEWGMTPPVRRIERPDRPST